MMVLLLVNTIWPPASTTTTLGRGLLYRPTTMWGWGGCWRMLTHIHIICVYYLYLHMYIRAYMHIVSTWWCLYRTFSHPIFSIFDTSWCHPSTRLRWALQLYFPKMRNRGGFLLSEPLSVDGKRFPRRRQGLQILTEIRRIYSMYIYMICIYLTYIYM